MNKPPDTAGAGPLTRAELLIVVGVLLILAAIICSTLLLVRRDNTAKGAQQALAQPLPHPTTEPGLLHAPIDSGSNRPLSTPAVGDWAVGSPSLPLDTNMPPGGSLGWVGEGDTLSGSAAQSAPGPNPTTTTNTEHQN